MNAPRDDGLRESYDQLPYETRARRKTHPDTLATLATVFGLTPPPVEAARVLELGCGTGENLLAIACALPGSSCVGVDFSAPQITEADRRKRSESIVDNDNGVSDIRVVSHCIGAVKGLKVVRAGII